MPKEEWGVKRVCPATGKRFYDMNRSPVVSPYTGEVVPVDTGTRTRILVADKDDADAKKGDDGDLLLDDDEVDLEDDDATTDGDDDADVLDDEADDDDTVSLDEIGEVGDDDD